MNDWNWMYGIQQTINYIENHLYDDLNTEQVAQIAYSSNAHFQRVFSVVTGITVGDYIRYRRLSLAGRELLETGDRILDLALKYRYDTHESFTKAFTRFHGIPPSAARQSKDCLRYYAPLSLQINVRGGFIMTRKLIPNVPLIAMFADGYMYLTSVIGALYGALKALGEEYTHAELLSLSGFGNRMCWTSGKWVYGNEVIDSYLEHPFDLQSSVLNAIGWKSVQVNVVRDADGNPLNTTDERIRRDFIDSLDKGVPVLAQGITNDGAKHEYDVFFGYEDNGERIIGWDYYQHNDEHFIREKWERELQGYILLTGKTEPVPERERVIDMFRFIVSGAQKTQVRGRAVGLSAWEAYLHDLESDDFLTCSLHPPVYKTEQELRQANLTGVHDVSQRFGIYCDVLCMISQRGETAKYCKELAEKYPEWCTELMAAADAWETCGRYAGFLWSLGLSFNDTGYEKFREPETRKILADEGRRAMELDRTAVNQIETILRRM